jgi:hypothetical protein
VVKSPCRRTHDAVPSSPKLASIFFLNCTKNTELTPLPSIHTVTLTSQFWQMKATHSSRDLKNPAVKSRRFPTEVSPTPCPSVSPVFKVFFRYPKSLHYAPPTPLAAPKTALLHNCERPMNSSCGNQIHHPRTNPVIVEDTTCCVSLLTGTISGSKFAIP